MMKTEKRHFFSLVELLIAMVIFVIMMGVLLRFAFYANKLWRASVNNGVMMQQAQVVFSLLEQDLRRMKVCSDKAHNGDVMIEEVPWAWYGGFEEEKDTSGNKVRFICIPMDGKYFDDTKERIAIYCFLPNSSTVSAELTNPREQKYKNTLVRWVKTNEDWTKNWSDDGITFDFVQNVRSIDTHNDELYDGDELKEGKNEYDYNYMDIKPVDDRNATNEESQSRSYQNYVKTRPTLHDFKRYLPASEIVATNVQKFEFFGGDWMSRNTPALYKCPDQSMPTFTKAYPEFRSNVAPKCILVEVSFANKAVAGDSLEDYDDADDV